MSAQGSVPTGCVPSGRCLGSGDVCLGSGDVCLGSGGVCLGGGDVCLGWCLSRVCVCLGRVYPATPRQIPHPLSLNRITDKYENITFPQLLLRTVIISRDVYLNLNRDAECWMHECYIHVSGLLSVICIILKIEMSFPYKFFQKYDCNYNVYGPFVTCLFRKFGIDVGSRVLSPLKG